MKILITGASGFVGNRVLEMLKKTKHEIIALSATKIQDVEVIDSKGYLFDDRYIAGSCPGIEVILHIGAFIPKIGNDANNIELSTSNVNNSLKLIKEAEYLKNLKKIVFISSVDVYSESEDVLTENTPLIPQTMYGWSKLYCEEMIKTVAKQKEIGYEILRLGHVYGEGEEKFKKAMPVMIKNAIIGKDIDIYGDGEAIRTFIYIDDVARAIINAIDHRESDTINVVGNESVTINELAHMIINIVNAKVRVNHIASQIPNRNLLFDNSKLMSTLIENLTPFSNGLVKEIEYMKALIR